MYIVKTEANENGLHLFQSQSHRTECWEDGYIEVPEALIPVLTESRGFCDLTIENGVLTKITPRPDLIPPVPEPEPSANELINALLGVTSYE